MNTTKTGRKILWSIMWVAVAITISACTSGVTVDREDPPASEATPSPDSTATEPGTSEAAGTPRSGDDLAGGFSWLLRRHERVLEGWTHNGAGAFVPTDDGVRTRGGIGLLWYSARPFRDFELRLQWRVASPDDNSGVFVRFPPPTDPSVAVPGGLEIQIYDGATGEPQKTGALYDVQPAFRRNSNAPGAWNDYTIRVVGNQVTVVLNGLEVNTYEAPEGALPQSGHLGLQNHGPDDVVWFRRVRIRELDARPGPSTGTDPGSVMKRRW